jgi:hypothetical protein
MSVIAGDFTNFDGALPASLGKAFVKFVNEWYDDGEVNANIRKMLVGHMTNATHIAGDIVYQVVDGNPSGNPITSIYNSFCNVMMCHMVLTQDLRLRDDHFEMVVYGDDNVITVNSPNLRCSDLAPHILRRFGMTYTHWSKHESALHDTLLTVSFIGRSFVYDCGIYRAPLNLQVIREACYWLKGDVETDLVMLSIADSTFMELSHHMQGTFRVETSVWLKAACEVMPHLQEALELRLRSYWSYREDMYNSTKSLISPYSPSF